MKKILIIGATGMAGHMIYKYLLERNEFELYTACYRNKIHEKSYIIDVRKEKDVANLIYLIKPDYVINCVGVLIKGSKESIENAIYINAYFPHMLERILHNTTGKLIHISTDCVFSGEKGQYVDNDPKDALDTYGMTKNLGEVVNTKDITLRTSIIGPELKNNGEGLFHWIYSQKQKDSIQGYEKSVWSGVTTLELAKAIYTILNTDISGLIQISNNESITKHDLLCLINDTFNLGIQIQRVAGPVIDKSIISSKLPALSYVVPSYVSMIDEMKAFMIRNKELYTQYLG